MLTRVLILSLCLTFTLPAAMIDDLAPVVASAEEELPPAFQLNLSTLLSLVLLHTYPELDDPDVQDNVLNVITPAYEAFLNFLLAGMINGLGPGFETPTVASAAVEILPPGTTTLGTPGGASPLSTSVPEPGTWLLAAAGLALLAKQRSSRAG